MSEYETLGAGAVASHLVTDLQTIDDFVSVSISKFLVAVLIFAEPFTHWHAIAMPLIWIALALYTVEAFRREALSRKARKATRTV